MFVYVHVPIVTISVVDYNTGRGQLKHLDMPHRILNPNSQVLNPSPDSIYISQVLTLALTLYSLALTLL